MKNKYEIIDLSQEIKPGDENEFESVEIKHINHKKGAFLIGLSGYISEKNFFFSIISILKAFFKGQLITARDFPDGLGLAWEKISLSTHTGTHIDAPWHFGEKTGGDKAKTIEAIPLEYCFADGVMLDLSQKPPQSLITKQDLQDSLKKINYHLKENDIVLIKTCARKNDKNYKFNHPGLSEEGILWLLDQGMHIVGTDGWGFDRPAKRMIEDYNKTKDKKSLWPAHIVGRHKEYWHIEKLDNLDRINKPFDFKVACFPIKLSNASAAWSRIVAIIEK
jgi:kynurenine formamidase